MSIEKSYSMDETSKVGYEGMRIVRHFVESHPSHIKFLNVEEDKFYQKKDIDFFWAYVKDGAYLGASCELKTDTYKTNNFFFETHSNIEKGTPGCFMYTEAQFLFYYFINKSELYVMHTETVRAWFLANIDRFTEKFLNTKSDDGSKRYYRSAGRLVPITTLLDECGERVMKFHLPKETAHQKNVYKNLNKNYWKYKKSEV